MEDHFSSSGPQSRVNANLKYLDKLATIGWLSTQPPGFQETIASLGRWVTLPAGTRIYSAGDPSDALIGLEQGNIDVLIAISGEEECTFYRAGPGDWLGDGGLLFGEARQLSLETVTPVRIFNVPQISLRQHLARQPADWRYLFHLATNRMMMAADLVSTLIALPPQARVARQLMRLHKKDGNVMSKQEDLAKLVGMSRATFRRAIEQLVETRAIETKYGRLTILDISKVEAATEI